VLSLHATVEGKVVDERGRPVVGAYVRFTRRDNGDFGHAMTGPDGAYRATAMAGAGLYEATVFPSEAIDGPLELVNPEAARVSLEAGDSLVRDVLLRVRFPRCRLTGRVVREGRPVAGARVEASPRGVEGTELSAVGWTSDRGEFDLGEVFATRYRLTAAAEGGATASVEVAAATVPVEIVLPR
jgi:hypothetical protein